MTNHEHNHPSSLSIAHTSEAVQKFCCCIEFSLVEHPEKTNTSVDSHIWWAVVTLSKFHRRPCNARILPQRLNAPSSHDHHIHQTHQLLYNRAVLYSSSGCRSPAFANPSTQLDTGTEACKSSLSASLLKRQGFRRLQSYSNCCAEVDYPLPSNPTRAHLGAQPQAFLNDKNATEAK